VDEVTQFLVEEACFELATMLEHRAGSEQVGVEAEPSQHERHRQIMAGLG